MSLYFCFNEIINEPGTSFQFPGLTWKHVWWCLGFERNKGQCNFNCAAMPIWCGIFWNMWIALKHKNLDISRKKPSKSKTKVEQTARYIKGAWD